MNRVKIPQATFDAQHTRSVVLDPTQFGSMISGNFTSGTPAVTTNGWQTNATGAQTVNTVSGKLVATTAGSDNTLIFLQGPPGTIYIDPSRPGQVYLRAQVLATVSGEPNFSVGVTSHDMNGANGNVLGTNGGGVLASGTTIAINTKDGGQNYWAESANGTTVNRDLSTVPGAVKENIFGIHWDKALAAPNRLQISYSIDGKKMFRSGGQGPHDVIRHELAFNSGQSIAARPYVAIKDGGSNANTLAIEYGRWDVSREPIIPT